MARYRIRYYRTNDSIHNPYGARIICIREKKSQPDYKVADGVGTNWEQAKKNAIANAKLELTRSAPPPDEEIEFL